MKSFPCGSKPVVTAKFRDANGVLTSPTTVQVQVQTPAGTETPTNSPDATLTNPSTGVWVYAFPAALNTSGIYVVRFEGTATLIAAQEESFEIEPSNFVSP